MVFPNMQPVFAFDAFSGHAWAHNFGEPININRMHVKSLLDLFAHSVGPRLSAKNTNLQRRLARIEALATVFVKN